MANTYIIRHETLDGIAEAIKTRRGRDEGIYVEEMAEEILNISNAELPELANPGDAEDLAQGVQLIDETGAVVTGTYTIDNELTAQDQLIAQIQSALEGKAAGGGSGDSGIKTCTVNFVAEDSVNYGYQLIRFRDNYFCIDDDWPYGSCTVDNVLCNSRFFCEGAYNEDTQEYYGNILVESDDGTSYCEYPYVYIGTSNATITFAKEEGDL